uniref:Uncharacterized protein n=1 Tax=Oryza nivara TaxID=4536 RepID=A0A0E0IXH3_ORYNI
MALSLGRSVPHALALTLDSRGGRFSASENGAEPRKLNAARPGTEDGLSRGGRVLPQHSHWLGGGLGDQRQRKWC